MDKIQSLSFKATSIFCSSQKRSVPYSARRALSDVVLKNGGQKLFQAMDSHCEYAINISNTDGESSQCLSVETPLPDDELETGKIFDHIHIILDVEIPLSCSYCLSFINEIPP